VCLLTCSLVCGIMHKAANRILIFKMLRDAYHRWWAMVSLSSTQLTRALTTPESTFDDINSLRSICPACFTFFNDELDDDRVVYVALDGNMQHCRYKDTH